MLSGAPFADDMVGSKRGQTCSILHGSGSVGSGATRYAFASHACSRLLGAHTFRFSDDLGAGGFQAAVAIEVGVKRGGADAQRLRHVDHARIGDRKQRLGRPDLVGRHLLRSATFAAACSRRLDTGAGSFDNKIALILGEHGEEIEHKLAVRGGGVQHGALAGQNFNSDTSGSEIVNDIHEVPQTAAQPAELPDNEDVTRLKGFEAGFQPWALIAASTHQILIKPVSFEAASQQRITLQVDGLRAVRLRDAHVANLNFGLLRNGHTAFAVH